jgi:hypothetical protein
VAAAPGMTRQLEGQTPRILPRLPPPKAREGDQKERADCQGRLTSTTSKQRGVERELTGSA